MIDIDDALHDHARQWIDDEPAPPDLDTALTLAKSSRHPRRWPVVMTAAACVLAVAIAITLFATRSSPASHHIVAARSISAVDRASLLAAGRRVAQRDIAGPWSVEVVATTAGAAQRLIDPSSDNTSTRPTLFVQVVGRVTSPVRGRAVRLEFHRFDVGSGAFATGVEEQVLDLSRLGRVIDLGGGHGSSVIVPSSVFLAQRARQVARSNGDPHATAQAVFTDYESAEAATNAGTTNVPNHPAVLIQLHGHFTCRTCRGPTSITGRYITLILFATPPYYGTDFGISNQRADLASLGPVITLRP